MIFYFIPLLIIVFSFLVIFFIVIKKFPKLANINIETIPEEKEARVANRLILERLSRKFIFFKKFISKLFSPVGKIIKEKFENFYEKAIDLEKKALRQSAPLKKLDLNQDIKDMVIQAKQFIVDRDFLKAEEKCISILEIDDKNPDAYEIFCEMYIESKDYKKARETCRYLCKLLLKMGKEKIDNHRLANCYADLGWIYQLEGRNNYALSNYQKASGLEPNNPRFLDLILKISIILKDKNLALQVFNNLKEADPENKKLVELKAEIDELPDK
jgi:tetratricopeptide (TPR) repeat protein